MRLDLALAVVGLGLAALGWIALRDEPPPWALKVPRPGWVLSLGIVAVIAATVVNYYRWSMEEAVEDNVGKKVDCETVGSLDVEGERRDTDLCRIEGTDEQVGCFVRNGDGMSDVTVRVERGDLGEPLEC